MDVIRSRFCPSTYSILLVASERHPQREPKLVLHGWYSVLCHKLSILRFSQAAESADIVVFPEKVEYETFDGAIQARMDRSLQYSVISTGMLSRFPLQYTPCPPKPAQDSKGTNHKPIGTAELRWHRKNGAKSYSETFYVVESVTPFVILGAPSLVHGSQSTVMPIHPLGVQAPSAGRIRFFLNLETLWNSRS